MRRNKVSYVKKSFAKRSIISLGLVSVGLLFMILGLTISVYQGGQGGLNVAAFGFCSLLLSLVGSWYALLSFSEKDKKYSLARVGVALGGIQILIWILLIIMGFGG